jgi:hypothetical protein
MSMYQKQLAPSVLGLMGAAVSGAWRGVQACGARACGGGARVEAGKSRKHVAADDVELIVGQRRRVRGAAQLVPVCRRHRILRVEHGVPAALGH